MHTVKRILALLLLLASPAHAGVWIDDQFAAIAVINGAAGGGETKCVGYSTDCAETGDPGTSLADTLYTRCEIATPGEAGTVQEIGVYVSTSTSPVGNAKVAFYKQVGGSGDISLVGSADFAVSTGWIWTDVSGSGWTFGATDVVFPCYSVNLSSGSITFRRDADGLISRAESYLPDPLGALTSAYDVGLILKYEN